MPEFDQLHDLPTEMTAILTTPTLNARLEQHLNGPFKEAESRSMRIIDGLLQDTGMNPEQVAIVKLGDLCTDLGKTGGLPIPGEIGVNELVNSIYGLQHQAAPDKRTISEVIDDNRAVLENQLQARGITTGLNIVASQLLEHYHLTADSVLRNFFNKHVFDSLEVFDQACQEAVRPEFDEAFAKARTIIGLHHAYRGVVPEGLDLSMIDYGCLAVMAADMYDAFVSRIGEDGKPKEHAEAIEKISENFAHIKVVAASGKYGQLPVDYDENLSSVLSKLKAMQEKLRGIYTYS